MILILKTNALAVILKMKTAIGVCWSDTGNSDDNSGSDGSDSDGDNNNHADDDSHANDGNGNDCDSKNKWWQRCCMPRPQYCGSLIIVHGCRV